MESGGEEKKIRAPVGNWTQFVQSVA